MRRRPGAWLRLEGAVRVGAFNFLVLERKACLARAALEQWVQQVRALRALVAEDPQGPDAAEVRMAAAALTQGGLDHGLAVRIETSYRVARGLGAISLALGALGSPEAAKALSFAKTTDANTKAAIADSLLECAEKLVAAGNKAEAKAAYEKILASKPTEAVKVAATLGVAASS